MRASSILPSVVGARLSRILATCAATSLIIMFTFFSTGPWLKVVVLPAIAVGSISRIVAWAVSRAAWSRDSSAMRLVRATAWVHHLEGAAMVWPMAIALLVLPIWVRAHFGREALTPYFLCQALATTPWSTFALTVAYGSAAWRLARRDDRALEGPIGLGRYVVAAGALGALIDHRHDVAVLYAMIGAGMAMLFLPLLPLCRAVLLSERKKLEAVLVVQALDEPELEALMAVARSGPPTARMAAIDLLLLRCDRARLNPLLEAWIDDSPRPLKMHAYRAWHQINPSADLRGLERALASEEADLVAWVAELVQLRGRRDAERILVGLLDRDDPKIAAAVARSLGFVGSSRAILPLSVKRSASVLGTRVHREASAAMRRIWRRIDRQGGRGQLSIEDAGMDGALSPPPEIGALSELSPRVSASRGLEGSGHQDPR